MRTEAATIALVVAVTCGSKSTVTTSSTCGSGQVTDAVPASLVP